MKVQRGIHYGVVVTMSHVELVHLLCVLDAAERNYRGVTHAISSQAAASMCERIDGMRKELETFQ